MSYAQMTAFAAPATHRPQVWRFVLCLALAFVIYMLTLLGFGAGLLVAIGPENLNLTLLEKPPLDRPVGMLVMLATFIGMALGPMVAVKMAHARSAWTLFGPGRDMARDFVLAMLAAGVLIALSLAVYAVILMPVPNLDAGLWLRLLPLALLGVLIQTGAEEVLFRGYMQQQLAARFRSPVIWMVVPSVLFGLAHYNPDLGPAAVMVVLATGTFGLVAADLTARTGTIGAAWGLHFANNVAAMLLISADRDMTGLALFGLPFDLAEHDAMVPLMGLDIVTTLVIWLLARWAVRR